MNHLLPELPYPFDALEPYYDQQTLRIHYEVHHKAYVDRLNQAEKNLCEAKKMGDYEGIIHWKKEIAYYGSSHLLHSLFWENMSPNGGGKPMGSIATRIEIDFGSFEVFRNQFTEAALAVEGSGWAVLVWNPIFEQLEILQVEKHQDLSQWGVIPLLTVDLWEHAYCLKYRNKKLDWINAWWHLINWELVNCHFELAVQQSSLVANFQ